MFESTEHRSFKELQLPGLPPNMQTFTISGIQLSFSDIIALAGDYYAIAKSPICLGLNDQDRKNRFLNAYDTLAHSKKHKIKKIISIIDGQTKAINKAIAEGKSEYAGVLHYRFKEILKALSYTNFKIVRIFTMSLDHMGENATIAHHIGHTLAIEAAARAHYIDDPQQKYEQLAYAYSLEAFACHFLTDHFSSGHLRTPSLALYYKFGAELGTLLGLFMHSEENDIGLNVSNENGDAWKAYGDAHLFEMYNIQTKEITTKALQIVLNEVYNAFKSGQVPTDTKSSAYKLLPLFLAENHSPLFIEDKINKRLLYRANLDDIDCNEYKYLKHTKVPYILAHLLKRSIKDKVTTKEDVLLDKASPSNEDKLEAKIQTISNNLKKFSLFKADNNGQCPTKLSKKKPVQPCVPVKLQ